ncbi:RIP metalloprotease RseP [Yoonia sp. 208BN28-4]|uniref:RIP metalloprotease RseP n=1 Tax=Yoonia sp. 208BN28-4 TaxID=3126505 RepID=UPI00309C2959
MDLTQILPALSGTVFTLVFFVIALSVIVAIHEYGHYIVGRWSGIHAEVFSIGFGPVLASKVDKHGTKWQIAAYPFGGYVKFLGDANAASVGGDDEALEAVAQSRFTARNTMMGAPLWARTATVAAGPIFNFILAILIFAGYLMYQGTPVEPLTFDKMRDVPAGKESLFATDLQQGDQILTIGGFPVAGTQDRDSAISRLEPAPRIDYGINRDGREMTVEGPFPILPMVASIQPRSAADDAGLRVGDLITAVNGNQIVSFAELVAAKDAAGDDAMVLTVQRGEDELIKEVAPRRVDIPNADGNFDTVYLIGVTGELFFDHATEPVGVFTALSEGTQQLWWRITTSLSGLWHIFSGAISTCNLSGPVGIAQASGSMASQGAGSFVLFIGMLSAAVGLLNLFPIPILDGGHLVFYAYEAVTRRKPSDAALKFLMAGGLAVIGTLMIFALLNDLVLCP